MSRGEQPVPPVSLGWRSRDERRPNTDVSVEGVRSGTGASGRHRRLPAGGDPCPRRGERVREIDVARDRQRLRPPRRRQRRDRRPAAPLGHTGRGPQARPRNRLPDLLARARPVGRREPVPLDAAQRAAGLRPDGGMGDGEARRVRPRPAPEGADGRALARRAPAARSRQVAARPPEGAAARRADHGSGPRGSRASAHARARTQPFRSRDRLRQPPAAGGARDRRPHHRPPRRRVAGNVRRGRHDGGRPRGADDRQAARARLSGAARSRRGARGRARRHRPARRALRARRPDRRQGRDPRDRRRRGQRPAAVSPRARRDRASRRERGVRRPRARSPLASGAAPASRSSPS